MFTNHESEVKRFVYSDDADAEPMGRPPGPCEQALAIVKFGALGVADFGNSVFCGIPPSVRCTCCVDRAVLAETLRTHPDAQFIYVGVQPGTSKASFHLNINPYPLAKVLAADTDFDTGRGLLDDMIERRVVNCAEIDERIDGRPLSYLTQARLWDRLIANGLPVPNAAVMSSDNRGEEFGAPGGDPTGKSLHVFYATRPAPLDVWREIQEHMIVLLRADSNIINPGRRMRVGGGEQHMLSLGRCQQIENFLRVGGGRCLFSGQR